MTTSGGRAKFVESMEGIMKGVKQVQLGSLFGLPSDIVEIWIWTFLNFELGVSCDTCCSVII
jgi:hypothetical protein